MRPITNAPSMAAESAAAAGVSTALLDEWTALFDAAGGTALRDGSVEPLGKNDVLIVVDMQVSQLVALFAMWLDTARIYVVYGT